MFNQRVRDKFERMGIEKGIHMSDGNKTIIYYSSNREPWGFESKVIETIKKNSGGLPVVSVTQKPIDFGTNICVGEQLCSYHNCYRQVQLAAQAAKTEYVISCESDCLYPPEYFQCDPDGKYDLYKYMNIWMLFTNRTQFYKKVFSECGHITKREFLINRIAHCMQRMSMWGNQSKMQNVYKKMAWGEFTHEHPIINVKTGCGVNKTTGVLKNVNPETTLPYWGDFNKVKTEMCV